MSRKLNSKENKRRWEKGTRGGRESLEPDHDVGLTPVEAESEGRKIV